MTSEPQPDPAFAKRLAGLARQIADHDDFTAIGATTQTLHLMMDAVVGVRWATFTRWRRPRDEPRTTASTGSVGSELDQLQFDVHQGPSLEALASECPVLAGDLGSDTRWPRFTARAIERTPARSVFSYPLARTGSPDYSLNLYTDRLGAFSLEDPALLMAVTAGGFAMAAIAMRQRADNLAAAMVSNREIGAATGILMARHGWKTEQSFDAIRRCSQLQHRKVRELARDVLKHGDLVDLVELVDLAGAGNDNRPDAGPIDAKPSDG